jgi:hypothetical protein
MPGPDEYATALERADRSLAVLAELRPAESRTPLLQAAGRTYAGDRVESHRAGTSGRGLASGLA